MALFKPHSRFEDAFAIGIVIKGIDGAIELIFGFVVLLVTPAQITGLASLLTQRELAEDPQSFVANTIMHVAHTYGQSGSLFLAVYLWIHAIVKLVAVIGILAQKLWAYPFSLITLGLLLLYQIIDIIHKPSAFIIALSIFDIIILWFIWIEYQHVKKRWHGKNAPPNDGPEEPTDVA